VTLASGNFKLILNKKEDVLWIGPEKPEEAVEIPGTTELWSFGSGEFTMGTVA